MSYAPVNLPKCCDCFEVSAPDCADTLILSLPSYPETDITLMLELPFPKTLQQTQTTDINGDLRIDLSIWRDRINRYGGPYRFALYLVGEPGKLWVETDNDMRQCFILRLFGLDAPPPEYRLDMGTDVCDCRPCRRLSPTSCETNNCAGSEPSPPVPGPDCTRFEFRINVTGLTPYINPATGKPEITGAVYVGDDETGVLLFQSGVLLNPNNTVAGLLIAWINSIQVYLKPLLPSVEFSLSGNILTISFNRAEFISVFKTDVCEQNITVIS
ncbi:MAG TPA: hypothetical protein PKE69_26565, partial [Pyrinomonadaceae bacterium]|nr:hypothetical protein [Pyrinomonadaceae bacterium]